VKVFSICNEKIWWNGILTGMKWIVEREVSLHHKLIKTIQFNHGQYSNLQYFNRISTKQSQIRGAL